MARYADSRLDRGPRPSTGAQQWRQQKRPVVAIDLDEVLGHFIPQLCLFHNSAFGTALTPSDFWSYQFHEVWGGTRDAADAKMLRFFEDRYFLGADGEGIPPVEGARVVLERHAPHLELHVVTSRQHALEHLTREWLDRHYPGVFAGVHFGNHYGASGVKRSKPELCKAIGAVMLVDDSLSYALRCADAGVPTVLFGDYAWNQGERTNGRGAAGSGGGGSGSGSSNQAAATAAEAPLQLPSNVQRASGWDAVNVILTGLCPPRVVSVSAERHTSFYHTLVKQGLVQHRTVQLRALGQAMLVAADTAQQLERLGVVMKTKVRTTLVPVQSGHRTALEVTLARTPAYEEFCRDTPWPGPGGGQLLPHHRTGLLTEEEEEEVEVQEACAEAGMMGGGVLGGDRGEMEDEEGGVG